jgi:hypothetical protein
MFYPGAKFRIDDTKDKTGIAGKLDGGSRGEK